LALTLLLCLEQARGATSGATMAVTTTVNNTCSVNAAPMAFAPYVPGAGPQSGSTTLRVACTRSSVFNVGLDYGRTAGSSYTQRLLGSGTNTLQYNLYTSAGYATIWGDGSGATQYVTGTGAGTAAPVPLTVYGLLPDSAVNQLAVPGTYSDTILVVIVY
jgi:spore coat protein U-like protein